MRLPLQAAGCVLHAEASRCGDAQEVGLAQKLACPRMLAVMSGRHLRNCVWWPTPDKTAGGEFGSEACTCALAAVSWRHCYVQVVAQT